MNFFFGNEESSWKGKRVCRARVALTASYTSTIAEECVAMLRKLHSLGGWNPVISEFLLSKLALVQEGHQEDGEAVASGSASWPTGQDNLLCRLSGASFSCRYAAVLASLAVIGGVDSRPRLGGAVVLEDGSLGTVAKISLSGKLTIQSHETMAHMKCSLIQITRVSAFFVRAVWSQLPEVSVKHKLTKKIDVHI